MRTKEIITREFHFDNSKESDRHMKIMKNEGYEILSYSSENDWYFICRKEIETHKMKKI